jgi:hypothetical protein
MAEIAKTIIAVVGLACLWTVVFVLMFGASVIAFTQMITWILQ